MTEPTVLAAVITAVGGIIAAWIARGKSRARNKRKPE
jgi:hypothetical protein